MSTQVVIDIPASLGTLVPTLPAMPQLTDAQWNDVIVEGGALIFVAIMGLALLITIVRELSGAAAKDRAERRKYEAKRAATAERDRLSQEAWRLKHEAQRAAIGQH